MADTDIATAKYRVKKGKELAHAGAVLGGGTDVSLPPHVGYEVRHLVDEVQEDGTLKPVGHQAAEEARLEGELATAQPHERISILQAVRAEVAARLERLDVAIAAEEKFEAEAKAKLIAEQKAADKAAAKIADKPTTKPDGGK